MKNVEMNAEMQEMSMAEMKDVNGGSLIALAIVAGICLLVLKSDSEPAHK